MSLYGTLATALSCASSTRRPQGRGGFHLEERITTSLEPLGGESVESFDEELQKQAYHTS
jgi:hypothetical protein